MQAIHTRWHGPTNRLGSRVVASCQAGRITLACDGALPLRGQHRAAAVRLAEKLGWAGPWCGGQLRDGSFAWTLPDVYCHFTIESKET